MDETTDLSVYNSSAAYEAIASYKASAAFDTIGSSTAYNAASALNTAPALNTATAFNTATTYNTTSAYISPKTQLATYFSLGVLYTSFISYFFDLTGKTSCVVFKEVETIEQRLNGFFDRLLYRAPKVVSVYDVSCVRLPLDPISYICFFEIAITVLFLFLVLLSFALQKYFLPVVKKFDRAVRNRIARLNPYA